MSKSALRAMGAELTAALRANGGIIQRIPRNRGFNAFPATGRHRTMPRWMVVAIASQRAGV